MKHLIKKINSSHIALFGILVVVVIGGFSIFRQDKNIESLVVQEESYSAAAAETAVVVKAAAPADMDAFAQCIKEAGAKLYGAVWCPHCQAQKKAFGESVQYINYVECSLDGSKTQAPECKEAGIQGYPTWKFADGSEILGEASFVELGEMTGCPLDSDFSD